MDKVDTPIVSVVVPCLNRAHFLVPTIESVLEQDYPHIECIVIDGGSTDGTLEILKSYGEKIKWVSEPDRGHADAINKGWWMSKGEILAWLNADDLWTPGAVSKAVAYLQKHPEVDVVYGDYASISEDGKVISEIIKPREWDLIYAVKYCHYTIPQPASFMRRSILEKVGWLDPEFHNAKDHELWLRIGLIGTIKYVPTLLAYARSCVGLSQQLNIAKFKLQLTKKFFNNPNLPPPFNSRKFQRRALSNSYLVGSLYIWNGEKKDFKLFIEYLLKSLITDPLNLPYIIGKLFRTILSTILPYRLKQILKKGRRDVLDALANFSKDRA